MSTCSVPARYKKVPNWHYLGDSVGEENREKNPNKQNKSTKNTQELIQRARGVSYKEVSAYIPWLWNKHM